MIWHGDFDYIEIAMTGMMGIRCYINLVYTFFIQQRHFCVFHLPSPKPEALKNIVKGILEVSIMHSSYKVAMK